MIATAHNTCQSDMLPMLDNGARNHTAWCRTPRLALDISKELDWFIHQKSLLKYKSLEESMDSSKKICVNTKDYLELLRPPLKKDMAETGF
jgi:hypothetical protein